MQRTRQSTPTNKLPKQYRSELELYCERLERATKQYWKAARYTNIHTFSSIRYPEQARELIARIAKKNDVKETSLAYCLYQKKGLELINP
jgi:hypothetical protein